MLLKLLSVLLRRSPYSPGETVVSGILHALIEFLGLACHDTVVRIHGCAKGRFTPEVAMRNLANTPVLAHLTLVPVFGRMILAVIREIHNDRVSLVAEQWISGFHLNGISGQIKAA
ncbi:hypothetical protein glycerophosphoryl diester phosphodiesterase [Aspergillus fumigatus]|nr:hypothetical protein glycerophosphoryl diester phosphodiesterase [Aspergillus fumigatus]